MKHDKNDRNDRNDRKRRGKGTSLLLLLALPIFAMLYFTGLFGGDGFGFGSGIVSEPDNTNSTAETGAETVSNIIEIRIEETEIYFGDELCDSTDALKQKITETSSSKEYKLIHDNAIKSVYDEVILVLSELETALDLTVDYN